MAALTTERYEIKQALINRPLALPYFSLYRSKACSMNIGCVGLLPIKIVFHGIYIVCATSQSGYVFAAGMVSMNTHQQRLGLLCHGLPYYLLSLFFATYKINSLLFFTSSLSIRFRRWVSTVVSAINNCLLISFVVIPLPIKASTSFSLLVNFT